VPYTLTKIHEALQTEIKVGDHVGIFLSHQYTNPCLEAANLKGPDKLLHSFLVANNVAVSLVPVLTSFYYTTYDGEHYNECEIPEPGEVRLLTAFPDPRLANHKKIGKIPFLSGWPVDGHCIRHDESEPTHGGNDVSPGSVDKIYLKAAMIVGPVPSGVCTTEGVQIPSDMEEDEPTEWESEEVSEYYFKFACVLFYLCFINFRIKMRRMRKRVAARRRRRRRLVTMISEMTFGDNLWCI
jgi:hypothetical protein